MKLLKSLLLLPLLYLFVISIVSCSDDNESDSLQTTEIEYTIHNGQAVASAPYSGIHDNNLSAVMKLEEMDDSQTMITVTLSNTTDDVVYHMHAHDAADPTSTPNGTPYVETPNSMLFAQALEGNGAEASVSQVAEISYDELITNYTGFFVIHDPLQEISTVDISTYLVVGGFARSQEDVEFRSSVFNYDFNSGELSPDFAYTGAHNSNLSASIRVDELATDQSRVVIHIMNTIDGEVYHTHSHDMADPSTTPNGTPYIESPNNNVFASPITGNGSVAKATQISSMSYNMLITSYDGFFVIHDPLQPLTTVDPSTYVILGVFAR